MNAVNFGSVPIDDLAPREATPYAPPFGKGRFSVELTSEFGVLQSKNGWEAVKITFANGASLVGGTEPTGTIDATFTTAHDTSEKAVSIGAQQLTALGYALGIAEIEGGCANFSVDSADDAIGKLQAGVGGRVGITVTHKARTADNGNVYTDMVVSQIFRLDDLK